ncbi:related to aromatic amino acid transport protein aroP [Rhynchosporium agropyri]|uniref:Related to aromatic amino acid transport protein aroP n=1 Tax=Rhynchosporium agropyri TaxID=914238 RepID=A0A1E1KTT1_9HELO|nr:related to aromatic amino acid transport protein aroP [Rhynchosporium agropyri]
MVQPNNAYDNGIEMAHYQGMETNPYSGIEINSYGGNMSDDGFEKLALHQTANVYDEDPRSSLRRDLKTRQISMIALGGALGTGLLINTGPSLANSGPGSMLIGYALVGVLCFTVMSAMGEMAAWLPLPSGFTGFAARFVDPALGFALGWNYWFKYIITTPNNIIASVLVIRYWFNKAEYDGPGANGAIYVAVILAAIIAINYFGVGFFGEFEFWLSSAKVLVMLGLIIFTLVLATGGAGTNHRPTGFHYWNDPGAFAAYKISGGGGRFLGFWNVMTSAVFSYLGAELVGVTVGEAQNPRRAIPRAVKLTFFRIVFFYIVLILLLGMTVPYNSPQLLSANTESDETVSAEASPFVVAALIAGVNGLPDVINVCLLIFTFSAANSDLYIATRSLYSLAIEGNAPRNFGRTNDKGVPIYALALSSACCGIAFMSTDIGTFKTFSYFVTLVTIFGILTWISILVSHICFVRARKAQHIEDIALAYVSPFGVKGSYAALIFACIITLFNGWPTIVRNPVTGERFDWRNFIVCYIPIPIYLGMIFGYKIIMKTERVKAGHADLFGGKAKIDDDEAEFLAKEMRKKGGVIETKYQRYYRVTLGNFF